MHLSLRSRLISTISGAAIALGGSASLAGQVSAARPHVSSTLNLVCYSTPAPAYNLIIPAFKETSAGKNVTVNASYGASGDQANKVAQGLPADVVNLSLQPDVATLVKAGMVSSAWYKNKYHGFVTDSTTVFLLRPGNRKHIKTWDDLVKPGVQVLNPNPALSGGAKWNIMAAYGAELAEGKTPARAQAYLKKLFGHIVAQDSSAKNSLATFNTGKGDVLLAYQNEAIGDITSGNKLQYVVPPQSILIQNPAAVTKNSGNPAAARAFLNFLWTKKAQRYFAEVGYRPVRQDVFREFNFRTPKKLFTIQSLGGWPKNNAKFFDPSTGVWTRIEQGG